MSLIIRYADINDCKDLGKIHSESWKVAYKGIVPDTVLEKITKENSEKRFRNSYKQGIDENVLIFNDGQAIGFICIGKCRDKDLDSIYGEVWGIYLSPSVWRKGFGTELINWGINELKNRGYAKISLWVLEENISARRFYEKLGFVHDGTIKELNLGKPVNEYRYVKNV